MKQITRRLWIVGGVVALVVLLVFVQIVRDAIRTATEAEYNLHAGIAALGSLRRFVEKQGRWPESVEELETQVELRGGMYDWPEKKADILKRVTITYGVKLEDVAKAAPGVDSFPFVKVNLPVYRDSLRNDFEWLIQDCQKALKLPAGKTR